MGDILLLYPGPKPSALPSAGGSVPEGSSAQRTYCGQEGIQEAARKDSACGKRSAEMQAGSWEMPFHPTNLFNKVDVGRIFCKARGKQTDRQASLGPRELPGGAAGGRLLRGRDDGAGASVGSAATLGAFLSFQVFPSFLKGMYPSWKVSSTRGHLCTSGSVSPCKCPDCHPYIIIFQTRTLLEVKGDTLNRTKMTGANGTPDHPRVSFPVPCRRWLGSCAPRLSGSGTS